MNLITDPWIPIVRADGTREKIAPWQIAEQQNPVMEIAAPRPDFQGALYQFLIALLQCSVAPDGKIEWVKFVSEPPDVNQIKNAFDRLSHAFELYRDNGPAFMQEIGAIDAAKSEVIAQLLIDEPGINTEEKNRDLFIHSGQKRLVCESCCAAALYALSINGPPGGAGHMAGILGNGPVITLIGREAGSLWDQICLNIIPQDEFTSTDFDVDASIFPWLGPTKTSESCTSKKCPDGCARCGTFPEDKHPLHVYWGMARRIRLDGAVESGLCDICGENSDILFGRYLNKPKGFRYCGSWHHSLTPRKFTDRTTLPEPLKGNQAERSYANWLALTYCDDDRNIRAATNVHSFLEKQHLLATSSFKIHCFYYDMEPGQATARCWYEHHLPVISVDQEYREVFFSFVSDLIASAKDAVKELRSQVKAAWFSRPKDAKGDTSMIDQSFWQATEADFYQQLHRLAQLPADTRAMPATVAQEWLQTLRRKCLDLFDHWSLEGEAEDMDLKRVVKARRFLDTNLNKAKSIKKLHDIAKSTKEVA
jgi:CRISPR system Cascade subunit CasA